MSRPIQSITPSEEEQVGSTSEDRFEGEVRNAKQRTLPRWVGRPLAVLMLGYALYFLYAAGALPLPGIQHRSIHLAGGFVFALLLFAPARRLVRSRWVLAFDMVLAAAAIAGSVYVFRVFDTYEDRVGLPATTPDIVFGLIIFVIMFEVARRVTGWAFPIITAAFVWFALYGYLAPAPFTHAGFDVPRFVATFFYTLNGPYGQITQISASYILIFIIFAAFVVMSGAGDFIRDVARWALGRVRGGPAKIAVVASSFMGMLTGSSLANVASVGSVTIPMMKRTGYRANFAAGVEACSGMGAQIMPPIMGGSIFIMMEILGVPYWEIASSAFLIGILFYIALFFMVDLEAAKTGLAGLAREEQPRILPIVRRGWYHVIPLALVIYMLAVRGVSPSRAAFYGIVATMAVMLIAERSWHAFRRIYEALIKGVRDALVVISIVAMASLIAGIVTVTGFGVKLSTILIDLAGGNLLVLLLISAAASLILGMGVPILVAYAMLAVLVAPALIDLGVSPMAAHLFIFYFGVISAITPPVAPDAFVAAGIARSSPFRAALEAVRIAGALYLLPFLFVYNDVLLLNGPVPQIVVSAVTAALGVYALAGAWQGMLLPSLRIGWLGRLILAAAALALIVPDTKYSLSGLAALAVVQVAYYIRRGLRPGARQDLRPQVQGAAETAADVQTSSGGSNRET
ncbi:MAG: TRAP transporter fused permease subunit [Streptosporangiales bacterium]|nr:TRAP transporter fused permease subunit [Streptosporangiales bacterium]